MLIKIKYFNKSLRKSSKNLVLFTDEKFSLNGLKNELSKFELSYIADLLKSRDLKKNLQVFDIHSKKK